MVGQYNPANYGQDHLLFHFEKEINLHIAEYNALTMRATYYINFQNILLTVLIAWITVVANQWNSKTENIFIWGLLLGKSYISKIENNIKEVRISTLQKIVELGFGGHLELSIKL